MTRRLARRGLVVAAFGVVVAGLGGCAWVSSWFAKSPKAATPASAPAAVAPGEPVRDDRDDRDVQPASAAEAVCANYAQTVRLVPFPREAIIRGLDSGNATVRFAVDGTTLTIVSVRSSDPAFGNAAGDAVRLLACRVDRPTRFEVPFGWRTRS